MKKFLLFMMLLVTASFAWGQTTIASETFENSLNLFSGSGGSFYANNSGASDGPASSPFFTQGSRGYGVSNGTATITSSNVNTVGYSDIQLSFRLASFSISSASNGADAGDIVTVEVSPNGGTNYYSTVRVLGNNNARWSYSGGTGIASTTYDGNSSSVDFTPSGGGERTTDGYSTVTVTGLTETSNLRIKITLLNNASNERWVIDDFKVTGTATATPSIAISNGSIPAANVTQGDANVILQRYDLAVTDANATLNGLTVTTAGTYAASNLVNLKVRYSADATLDGSDATLSTKTTNLDAGVQAFSSFTSQVINTGTTGYLFVTTDIAANAVAGNTINIAATTDLADISFVSGTKSGSAAAGGAQTIVACSTPSQVTAFSASVASVQSVLSWTNGACYDEILVIASAGSAVSFTPSGDGSAYTANAAFSSGTDVGSSQFVVYKGTGTTETVTGLTNGTTYHYAVYTRKGNNWSAAVTASATPVIANATAILWATTNTPWLTGSNWTGGSVPTATQVAQFAASPSGGTVGINMNLSSTNNGTNNQIVGAIEVTSARSAALNIGNSSTTADGILTLTGVVVNSTPDVIVRHNGSGTLTLQANQTGRTMGVALGNTTENIVRIDGAGDLLISSIISGASRNLVLNGVGAGKLILTGANTYTGLTTVSAGTLQLNRTGGTTIPVGNDMTVTGGTLEVNSNQTLNNLTLNGGDVIVANGVTLTISGILTLTNGKITLGTGDLVVNGSISGGSASSYIVTSGSGMLKIGNIPTTNTTVTFPIGTNATNYNPLVASTSSNSSIAQLSARAKTTNTNAINAADIEKTVKQAWWDISSSGGINLDVTFQWNASQEGSQFSRSDAHVGIYTNEWTQYKVTPTGTDPYTATLSSNIVFDALLSLEFGIGNEDVLPVELTSFTANNTDKGVALSWTTATEENNRAFEVQRSSNGRDFETIATVAGAGTTYEAQNYNYLDEQPLNGVNYYRLKQVDFDGSFELHRVVAVLVAAKGSEVAILPTEVTTQFDLVFGEALTTDAQVQIYNFNGQLLHSETIAAGNQRQTIDAAAFAAGIYIVRVQTNGVSTAARFVKL